MKMVGSVEWNDSKSVSLEMGRWELIVVNMAVEYETHRDMVLNSGGASDEDVEFSRNQMAEVKRIIWSIQIHVGFEWFAADNIMWLENREELPPVVNIDGLLTDEQWEETYRMYVSILTIGDNYPGLVSDGVFDQLSEELVRNHIHTHYGIEVSNEMWDALDTQLYDNYQRRQREH